MEAPEFLNGDVKPKEGVDADGELKGRSPAAPPPLSC
jgi:hypothetical protein